MHLRDYSLKGKDSSKMKNWIEPSPRNISFGKLSYVLFWIFQKTIDIFLLNLSVYYDLFVIS